MGCTSGAEEGNGVPPSLLSMDLPCEAGDDAAVDELSPTAPPGENGEGELAAMDDALDTDPC